MTINDRTPITAVIRPDTAFEYIQIDVIGEIAPASSKGHKYVLCVVDMYSRWIECFPLKTLTAKETCDRLMEMFVKYGLPVALTSDNATNLVSGLTQEIYERLGIKLRLSTPYHPEGNSVVERANATVKKMLHHYITSSDKKRDWHEKLPYMLWAYREMPHSTVGLSPYQLVFGKVARGPLSVLRDSWIGESGRKPPLNRSSSEYLETLKHNLKFGHDIALKVAEKAQKTYVDNHNKHCKPKSFDVDDSVFILMPDSTNSLLSRWIGPATVVSKVSENSYNVLCDDGAVKTLHADKLRPFVKRIANVGVIFDDIDDNEFENIDSHVDTKDNGPITVDDRVKFDDLD